MTAREPTALEKTIGWTFAKEHRLLEALTHSTHANENPHAGPNNERLEFLGDAVLGLLAARILYERPGDEAEGEMSRRRARVVRRQALAALATEIGIEPHLRLGQGQSADGVSTRILADAYEALVGAVFLDGGFGAVEACFGDTLREAIEMAGQSIDFKTRLQEVCHQLGRPIPRYEIISVEGPDHARRFTCEVRIDSEPMGMGEGTSKKAAEQQCAEEALLRLDEELE